MWQNLDFFFSLSNRRKIQDLRNRYQGEQCILVGSGPSAQSAQDLLNRHPHLIATNSTYLILNKVQFWVCSHPAYLEVCDIRRVASLNASHFILPFGVPHLRAFPAEKTIGLLLQTRKFKTAVGRNLTKRLPWGPTVILDFALPLALWAGYSEILLVGCEYSLPFTRLDDTRQDAPKRHWKTDQKLEMGRALEKWQVWWNHLKETNQEHRIINCSSQSKIPHFTKKTLAEAMGVKEP